jgi:hypothetical protein
VEEKMTNTLLQQEIAQEIAGIEEVRRVAEQQRIDRARQIQALELQRENILSQRTSNPARRAALEAALTQIEAQIEALG